MTRAGLTLLLAVLILPACSGPESRLERLYASARDDIRRGAIERALAHIGEGQAAAGETRPAWAETFRLLKVEAHLLQRDLPAALALLGASPTPALTARREYLQALALVFQRKLPDALSVLERAAQREGQSAVRPWSDRDPDDPGVRFDIDNLRGQVLLRLGRWPEADALLQDLVTRAAAAGNDYQQAVALNNLGNGRISRNRFDEALVFFERVLQLSSVEDHTVYANALSNAGLSAARLGQFDRAVEVQQRAVASHERRDLPVYLEHALGELGNTYIIQEQPQEGMRHLSRAFDVATRADLKADAAIWAGNLAVAAAATGDFDRAETFNREATRLKAATSGNTLYNTLNAGLIALGRGQIARARDHYRDALEAAAADPAARWEAQTGLAKAALADGERAAAARYFDEALVTTRDVRSGLRKPEHRLTFLTRVIGFYRDYVDMLVAAGDTARALEVADSSRAVVLGERMGLVEAKHDVGAGRFVAAARQARSVWLAYWLGPERSYAWVVTGSGIQCVTLPDAGVIARAVERYRGVIEASSRDPLAAPGPGDELFRMIVDPVARYIPRGASVRIVPDGALHNVNFETLPVDGPRRRYWIEDVSVAIAPSLGLLAANAGRRTATGPSSLLLVGDPTPRLKEFPRLGYAPVEMDAVSRHFRDVVRHQGDRATPSGFLGAGPDGFGVIHFTAHAAANRTSPLDSAVILAGPAGADKLYARDVAERTLRAELVTISACRSAGERAYAGEGLIGFSWAFLRAGARQVVAGLWDVDDQSTAQIMDGLYAGVARGERVPDALRAAKLALMQRGGHVARPYYWGPFEVFTVEP